MYLVRKSTYRKLQHKYEQATRDLSRLYEENDRLREQIEEWRKEIAVHRRAIPGHPSRTIWLGRLQQKRQAPSKTVHPGYRGLMSSAFPVKSHPENHICHCLASAFGSHSRGSRDSFTSRVL